jgi:5-(aminomethyl)-3-furanmethanol phosphate kinase
MTMPPVRVIKLGGSLLDWPDWAGQFHRWLAAQSPAANVLVVGGGAIVDALRELDRASPLSAETAHWLAVRAMNLTAAVAAELLGDVPGLEVLDVESFLREDQHNADALPCGWHVTSDSIAARVATARKAGELVLLKSALPADRDYVDAHFPIAAGNQPVRFVNLRDPRFVEVASERRRATP